MTTLSKIFSGVAAKRLSAVETNPRVSNQHEFQGIRDMVEIFGKERKTIPCTYLYLGDDEQTSAASEGSITWYDSRENQPNRSPEYRYYYQGNAVTELANEGDLLIIAQKKDLTVLALVVKQGSNIEQQVLWLFGVEDTEGRFKVSSIEGDHDRQINFAERFILDALGVEVEIEDKNDWLDMIHRKFGNKFPTTKEFSAFARAIDNNISSIEDPDIALIEWLNQEELLFKTLERHLVEDKILKGFTSVDEFIGFSLTIQNRRKSRMGHALENHLAQIFADNKISFSKGKRTENKNKPDFIFPSIVSYHDLSFPSNKLFMLGSKSSCKDRWRQVLTEANRISNKHLLTLEPSISKNQTDEMIENKLRLVVPQPIQKSYLKSQQDWLLNLKNFIAIVR